MRTLASRVRLEPPHFAVDDTHPLYVLIPGMGADADNLSLLADELRAHGCQVLTALPAGFGSDTHGPVSLAEAGQSLQECPELGSGPKVAVGVSAGASAAMEWAIADPSVVQLVMVAGLFDQLSAFIHRPWRYGWRQPRRAWLFIGLLYFVGGFLPEWVLRRIETPTSWWCRQMRPLVAEPERLSPMDLRLITRTNRCRRGVRLVLHNRHYRPAPRARLVQVPVLAIEGEFDPLGTPATRSATFAAFPAADSATIAGVAHNLHIEAPSIVALKIASA